MYIIFCTYTRYCIFLVKSRSGLVFNLVHKQERYELRKKFFIAILQTVLESGHPSSFPDAATTARDASIPKPGISHMENDSTGAWKMSSSNPFSQNIRMGFLSLAVSPWNLKIKRTSSTWSRESGKNALKKRYGYTLDLHMKNLLQKILPFAVSLNTQKKY